MWCCVVCVVPESVYLLEKLERVKMSHNCIKELSSLIDTWERLRTLDLSFNQLTALHVSSILVVVFPRWEKGVG